MNHKDVVCNDKGLLPDPEALANIIGTQAGSGPPFYLPARLATIENRLQKVETTQDHHTECFKVLFDHFKIPLPGCVS